MSVPEAPPKRHGCFFYGCIISLALLFVVGLVAFLGIRSAIHRVNAMIAEYTDTQPMVWSKEEISSEELAALKARFSAFQDALEAHTNTPPPLVLTGREVNALLASAPEMAKIKDQFHFAIDGSQIKGQVSLRLDDLIKSSPLERVPFIDLKGRYLNGSGVFKAALTNSQLFLTVDSLEVKGKSLPAESLAQLSNQNLLANTQFTNSVLIKRSESIEIKDGKLTIVPKKPEAE